MTKKLFCSFCGSEVKQGEMTYFDNDLKKREVRGFQCSTCGLFVPLVHVKAAIEGEALLKNKPSILENLKAVTCGKITFSTIKEDENHGN